MKGYIDKAGHCDFHPNLTKKDKYPPISRLSETDGMVQKPRRQRIHPLFSFIFFGLFCAWPQAVWAGGPFDTWRVRAGNTFAKGIAYGNGLYVTGGAALPDAMLFASEDGGTWTAVYYGKPFPYDLSALTYGTRFVGVGQAGHILTSLDGYAWSAAAVPGITGAFIAVTYGGGSYVAVGEGGAIATSADGLTWTRRTSGTTAPLLGVAYGNGLFTAVGIGGTILTSGDGGATWLSQTAANPGDFFAIAYGGDVFVLVGLSGEIETSPNGATWTSRPLTGYPDLLGITYGGGFFVAAGGNGIDNSGIILTSTDGATWTSHTTLSDPLATVTYGNGSFIALSLGGTILQSDPLPSEGYLLTINKTGSGNLTALPAGIDCGAGCAAVYSPGTPVTLTAAPAANLLGWTGGGCTGNAPNCTVTLNAHTTVTAEFLPAGAPVGWLTFKDGATYTKTPSVVLFLNLYPANFGNITHVQFSNDGAQWIGPEVFDAADPKKSWLLSTGEGIKTVYVKYQDKAGIWSDAYGATIILDSVPPETSAQPPGGIYQAGQPVALITSEAAAIYYTTDGTTPTAGAGIYQAPLRLEASTTIKYFARDPAGNTEGVKTSVYQIATRGDINGDCRVDLMDAIIYLQVLNGGDPSGVSPDYALSGTDPDGDGRIGLTDAVFVLQTISGLRDL